MTETHCDDGNTLRERYRENITRKGNKELSQQVITRRGYLVYYDTKVSNL